MSLANNNHNIHLLTLTDAAQIHFAELLHKEFEGQPANLRISVSDPGTLKADVGITFCPLGDEQASDIVLNYANFILYIDCTAMQSLRDAVIDYKLNALGGQLSVKAPYIKGTAPKSDAPLGQRVQHIIDNEINPNLASHGGFVTLVDIVDNGIVVLKFGGGCHGCGMADVTLKSGIEKTLLEQCPDIIAIKDATDHAAGETPYYA